jgi:hypothetical protein
VPIFLNNFRRREHARIYNSVEEFFDLGTEGMQAGVAVASAGWHRA